MRICLDIETDALDATLIHLIAIQDIDTKEIRTYSNASFSTFKEDSVHFSLVVAHNGIEFDLRVLSELLNWVPTCPVIDTLILSRLLKYDIEGGHSLDAWGTRLKHPKGSISDFTTYTPEMLAYCINDVELTAKLYLFLTSKLNPKIFSKAIEVEHQVAHILRDTKRGGFPFDMKKMERLREEIATRVSELDGLIIQEFPPKLYSLGEYIPTLTKHGTISRSNLRWFETDDYSIFSDGAPFTRLGIEHFNPGSVKQIVTRLTDNDWWDPIERTNGYTEAKRTKDKDKQDKLDKYGWKLSETNLATLKDTAPESARFLVERLALNNRLSTFDQWEKECRIRTRLSEESILKIIAKYTDLKLGKDASTSILNILQSTTKLIKNELDYKELAESTDLLKSSISKLLHIEMAHVISVESIKNSMSITVTQQEVCVEFYAPDATHILRGLSNTVLLSNSTWQICGTIDGIGTWTHRCAHRRPNLANIAAKKSIKYKEVNLAKKITELGGRMRDLFHCGGGDSQWLVGTDAEGIQLRMFAHYTNDPALIKANVEGNKDLGTDIHTLNQRALGDCCRTRDDAKTWIYAYLLGAGLPKLSSILKCSAREGKQALDRLLTTYQSIKELRENAIPRDAAQGYFKGLDGRLVCCSSEHLMLAGYLQNGEVLVMKHAMVKWHEELRKDQINFRLANFVHDEWQTIVQGTRAEAEHVAKVQRESIAYAGRKLGVRCPLAGASVVGKTWLDTH